MKINFSLIVIIGSMMGLYACKNDNVEPKRIVNDNSIQENSVNANVVPGSIVADWNIVTDSTYAGVGSTNHPVNYAGQPGDYFDIRSNGYIYTKEGTVLDTLSYKLVPDAGIIIQGFGINLNGVQSTSHISNLTAHSVTIASSVILTPGGVFSRKVTLSK